MEKQKMLQILVPALALAGIIVIAGLIVYGTAPQVETTKGDPKDHKRPPSAADRKMMAEVKPSGDGIGKTKPEADAPGSKDLGDGLKVWDLNMGEGDVTINESDLGLWHYTGWLPNGTVFDSSIKRGDPTPFGLTQVIQGWTRGLVGMKVGAIRRLYIPSQLAYGSQGKDPIPPNTDLVFEVKLIRISR